MAKAFIVKLIRRYLFFLFFGFFFFVYFAVTKHTSILWCQVGRSAVPLWTKSIKKKVFPVWCGRGWLACKPIQHDWDELEHGLWSDLITNISLLLCLNRSRFNIWWKVWEQKSGGFSSSTVMNTVLDRRAQLSHMDIMFLCSHSFGDVAYHHLLWTNFLHQLFFPSFWRCRWAFSFRLPICPD